MKTIENVTIHKPSNLCESFNYLVSFIGRVCEELNIYDYEGFVDIEFLHDLDGHGGGSSGDDQTAYVSIAQHDSQGVIPIDEMLRNIAHELVHVQQFLSGRLDDFTWEGVDYFGTPYLERPWEIEAYEMEEKLCLM